MKTTSKYLATAIGFAVLSLGACSSNDSTTPAITAVPESAGVSVGAFVSFLQSLGESDETSEPLTIPDSFAVPADETT